MPIKDRSMNKQLSDADIFPTHIFEEERLNQMKSSATFPYDEPRLIPQQQVYLCPQ